MLMEWAKKDPVSSKEVNRNEGIYALQENRNPFVDYPGLEDYIWGSLKDVAFSYDHYQNATSVPVIEVNVTPIYPTGWYNLNGQKVGEERPSQKGVYIHNGKKVVVECNGMANKPFTNETIINKRITNLIKVHYERIKRN